jgi:PAS domain S-box-containing protein
MAAGDTPRPMTSAVTRLTQEGIYEGETAKVREVRILVVDDDPAKRLAMTAALHPLGFAIVEANSGAAALRCLMAQDFAVILLDVRMPTMDGFETAALIRLRERSERTPIIFITASSSDEMVSRNRYAQGAVDFIFAPVSPAELRAKVVVFADLFVNTELLAMKAREAQISADELRLLTDVAPIGIFRTDIDNRYVYLNPRWCQITGIPLQDALGQRLGFGLESETRVEDLARRADASDNAEFSYRFEIPGPDGTARVTVLTAVAIPDIGGGTSGWAGTLADITGEVQAEAALSEARDAATATSQIKSDFLANMSHEIRTPMNGVIGMTDLLLETHLDDRQRDYAQTVRESGEALLTIINSILDFSKLEAAMLRLDEIDFDVRMVVDGVVDLLVGSARDKNLELATVVEEAVPPLVRGDPGRLRQILVNLVGNAIKFTDSGRIGVHVKLDGLIGPESLLRFEVSDTGDGIARDKLTDVFQPFVQADTSTSRRYGGTGLGLAISSQLVSLMGGDCGASSEVGSGSTFWFTIRVVGPASSNADGRRSRGDTVVSPGPRSTAVDTGRRPPHVGKSPRPESPRPGAGRLLLAEDNLVNQRVAVAMLTSSGYLVDTVTDGAGAVKATADEAYDAILMDCQMPGLSGYEATAAIRAQEGSSRHTPIIAMTAGARAEDRERCLSAGMDSYLSKPVSKRALLEIVSSCMREQPRTVLLSPASVRLADHPVLDRELFDEIRTLEERGANGNLAALVDSFTSQTKVGLLQLRQALAERDAHSAKQVIYSIKASAGQLGGCRLVRSCDRLDNVRRYGMSGDGEAEIQRFESRVQEFLGALASELSRASNPVIIDAAAQVAATSDAAMGTDRVLTDQATQLLGPGGDRRRTGCVLLIEDNPINGHVGTRMLDKLGYRVQVVTDAAQALKLAASDNFDAIVIDGTASALDAERTIAQIRGRRPAEAGGPIIAVSASPTRAAQARCREAGADDYATKPFRLARLGAVLGRWQGRDFPAPAVDATAGATRGRLRDRFRPALDPRVLTQLKDLGATAGADFLSQLASLFLTDADRHVGELRRGLADADVDLVTKSAHALSGSSANLGAMELARLCSVMATDRGAERLLEDESVLVEIESEMGRVRFALAEHMTPL